MSALQEELQQLRAWKLKDEFKGSTMFDELLANEFLPLEEQFRRENYALLRLLNYAFLAVPYYRDLFNKRALKPDDIGTSADLVRLPLLTKRELYDHTKSLQAPQLPANEELFGWFSSSGTTGRPASVLMTQRSNSMFSILAHRHWRWARFDPSGKLATIRLASQLPKMNGQAIADGEVLVLPGWRYVSRFFHTGEGIFINVTNPVEQQIELLQEHQPDYLMAYSESLEHLAYAGGAPFPVRSVNGLIAISEQLTKEMKSRIERVFEAPVYQNYGLNEIGLVATMCQSGRYHVHTEHCLVEVVSESGEHCPPGETGRLIVTGLSNAAMPLIRYDTDDLAEAVDRNCPCGRTLPAFGKVEGRYSRITLLPEGTLAQVGTLHAAVESVSDELAKNLRKFQIYQYRDEGGFLLRLVCNGDLPTGFKQHVQRQWEQSGNVDVSLELVVVDSIPPGSGGKHQAFDSAYYPSSSGKE